MKSIITCLLFFSVLFPCLCPAQNYEIGHVSAAYYDPARPNRNIPAEIYYPADVPGDGVPVAEPEGEGFPVISFGHGYLMGWESYENIWTALVPEGYILAFPRTAGELFPDHLEFGLDLAFLINVLNLEDLDPGSLFYGKVGTTSAVMGHSMGGGASFLACQIDPGITAIVNLAAAETVPSAIEAAASVESAALLFSGSLDCVTPPENHQIPMYDELASRCRTLVNITGASHCQFAEQNFLCSLGEVGCEEPAITRAQQHSTVTRFLIPWLSFVLKAEEDGWATFKTNLENSGDVTSLHDCLIVRKALLPYRLP